MVDEGGVKNKKAGVEVEFAGRVDATPRKVLPVWDNASGIHIRVSHTCHISQYG